MAEGERLDRAALKMLAPLFPTTGQYNYAVAIPQQLRTLLTMPSHVEQLYDENFTLPGKSLDTIWHDSAIEEANAWTQSNTHRVNSANITQQMDEMPVVRAAHEGLLGGAGVRLEGGGSLGFERVRRSFGTDVEARLAMGALFRRCLFDRFHERDVRETLRNLFRADTPALNPKILDRRAIGRERLEEIVQARVLNVTLGGRYDVPPVSHRYGALQLMKKAVQKLSAAALQRRLRATTAALSALLDDGKYVAGPHCFADWDAQLQRFMPHHGNKAAMRDYLGKAFGGVGWSLVRVGGETRVVDAAGRELRATDLVVDFLMLARRLGVRQARTVGTPEQLIVAACQSEQLRSLLDSMGPDGRVHLHADQAITGTIEKGVTVAARAARAAPAARIALKAGRPLPPAVQRIPLMFARLMENRAARGDLFGLFPDAFDSLDAVRKVLPHPETQELHFLGFHSDRAVEWQVGKGAAALGRAQREGAAPRVVGLQPQRVKHLEADTSVFYTAMQVALSGGVAIVRMEDTDGVWISALAWALTRWWTGADVEVAGEVFIWVSAQYKTLDGDQWRATTHAGKEWRREELVSVRDRVAGIAGHKDLKHLAPLQAVLTMAYAAIFCGGDTTAYFRGLPHARCFALLLQHMGVIGPIVTDVRTERVKGQQVPKAEGVRAGIEKFVQVMYVAGAATANGRGANWPRFFKGRMSAEEERTFLSEIGWDKIWSTLVLDNVAALSKLPPSVGQILMQMGRANYRLAHWMRALLPTIDLSDVPTTGFMPLPGSGDALLADGSNAAFDWGAAENLHGHLPEQVAALRRRAQQRGTPGDTCRAILGPANARKRCGNKVHKKAGVEAGWAACTCGIASHRASTTFELGEGEQWSAEAEAAEEARRAAAPTSVPVDLNADDLEALDAAGFTVDDDGDEGDEEGDAEGSDGGEGDDGAERGRGTA